jgi:hypothetical protein
VSRGGELVPQPPSAAAAITPRSLFVDHAIRGAY